MISCIGARQRGQAIPLLLLARSDTTHPQHSYSLLSRQFTTNPTVSLCARNFRAYDQPCRSGTTCKAIGFNAETTCLLGIAFEMAIVALQHADGVVAPTRDVLAQKIIELAKAGERDPERLCVRALKATQAPVLISDTSPLPPHASPLAQPDS